MKTILVTVVICALTAGGVVAQNAAPRATPASSPSASGAQPAQAALPSASDYSSQILPEVKGVVSWRTLAQVVPVKQKDRFVPQFSDGVAKLDKTEVRLQGFMMPLEPGERQSRFLLTAVPSDCSFCMPAGPDSIVEVRAKTAVKYGPEPVVVSGRLVILKDGPTGLYYRVVDAVQVSVR